MAKIKKGIPTFAEALETLARHSARKRLTRSPAAIAKHKRTLARKRIERARWKRLAKAEAERQQRIAKAPHLFGKRLAGSEYPLLIVRAMEPGVWYTAGAVRVASGLDYATVNKKWPDLHARGFLERAPHPDGPTQENGKGPLTRFVSRLAERGVALRREGVVPPRRGVRQPRERVGR